MSNYERSSAGNTRKVYFDNASTTQPDYRVVDAMMPYFVSNKHFGNPGCIHNLGRDAKDAVEHARTQVAALINAQPDQIIFTSGGSEANNLAIKGVEDYLKSKGKTTILTDAGEHLSLLKSVEYMSMKREFHKYILGLLPDGSVDYEAVIDRLSEDNSIGLVSIMHTNNETGAVNHIQDIGRECRKRGIIFHTDCVQAAGFHELDVEKFQCDLLSISSHKIHGCKGMGALFVRDKSILSPIISGGADQEYGLRGGTENVPGIVGFGQACEIATNQREQTLGNVVELRKKIVEKLEDMRDRGLIEFAINNDYMYNKIINLRIYGVDAETLVLFLGDLGVFLSAGSACNSREHTPSHVLKACGFSDEYARECIRISLSRMNSEEDVELFINKLEKVIEVVFR